MTPTNVGLIGLAILFVWMRLNKEFVKQQKAIANGEELDPSAEKATHKHGWLVYLGLTIMLTGLFGQCRATVGNFSERSDRIAACKKACQDKWWKSQKSIEQGWADPAAAARMRGMWGKTQQGAEDLAFHEKGECEDRCR